MNIAVVTFHQALNQGAVLQAYALQCFLEKQGHTVEFVEYEHTRHSSFRQFVAKNPLLMLKKWRNEYNEWHYRNKQPAFNCMLKKSQPCKDYSQLTQLAKTYDCVIAGSDQIWNFQNKVEPYWMLGFVPDNIRKIAYAASMGQCRIEDCALADFKKLLLRFDAISLREDNAFDLVKGLMHERVPVECTVDPTLLLSASDYSPIETGCEANGSFIVSYVLNEMLTGDNMKWIDGIRRQFGHSRHINLRNPSTCKIMGRQHDKIVRPGEWLGYMRKSDFVIASSFHAVVFAIIYHRPFVSLDGLQANKRVHSLLKPIGLEHRCVATYDEDKMRTLLTEQIDWHDVETRLKEKVTASAQFLNNAINR